MLEGLTALEGADLAEEEIRLLAIGARVAADLHALPQATRPRDLAELWAPPLPCSASQRTWPGGHG